MSSTYLPPEPVLPSDTVTANEFSQGVDRRAFMMRSAVVGEAAVVTGRAPLDARQIANTLTPAPQPTTLSPQLDVFCSIAIHTNRRVDFDTTERGLAVSFVLG